MIAGAISAVGNIFFFAAMFGGDDRDNPLGAIGALATIIIAPLAASLLQLAVSRQREYLADATAAKTLGTGEPLAQALETLERVANLFSTHPPLEERIARLREYDRSRGIV
jgi:heat shock protein HtpX